MSDSFLPIDRLQDLVDGPGELGAGDHGKLMVWDNGAGHMIMIAPPRRSGGFAGRSALRVQDAPDGPGVLSAIDHGKVMTWDDTAKRFAMLAGGGGSAPGGSTTQVQYNSAGVLAGDAGMTYDEANDALTVAGRVVTGAIRPAADGATALQVQTAAGSAVLTVNTATLGILTGGGVEFNRNGSATVGDFSISGSISPGMYFGRLSPLTGDSTVFYFRSRLNQAKFTINTAGSGNVAVNLEATGGAAFIIYGATSNVFERFRVNENGTVGIGNPSPTALLSIAASTTARSQLRFDPTSAADPTSPNNGDMWYNSRLKFCRSSTTEIIPSAAAQGAFTQTYSTAARTVNAYTTDAEAAYNGQDNLQVGSVYAKYADLESLRVAYTNLEASHLNLLQVVTALIDDGQAFGMT